MKVYEALAIAQPLILRLQKAGLKSKDFQYLQLFQDYEVLLKENYKKSYIQYRLCERYNVGRTKYYAIMKIFKSFC